MDTPSPTDDLIGKLSDVGTTAAACAFGAVAACVLAFPAAMITALLYRFPIPFAGYASGFEAVGPAAVAVVFYGILGGFVVLAVAGAIAGAFAHARVGPRKPPVRRMTLWIVLAIDVAATVLLGSLDLIIGPW